MTVDRRNAYVKLDRTSLQLYPSKMSRETPRVQSARIAKLLEVAAMALSGW